jgi:antitoxin component YwqK of YwqJK toxin-antitoxin module
MRRACALIALAACAAAPERTDAVLSCPPGTTVHYTPPPRGPERACQRPDGVRHGPSLAYFADGKPRFTGGYADDQPDGHWIWWRENGRKQSEGDLRAGKLVGAYRLWHDNGQLYVSDTYVDGKPEGEATRYHANGQRAAHGALHDGRKDGLWTFWYPNGVRAREGRYDRGRKIGRWSQWDDAGRELPDDGAAP